MEHEKKEFTGIWVPVEVLELDSVTGNEMLLLSYIIGLSNNERGCYATNKHLGDRLGLSKGRISEMVSSLFNKGLITYQIFKNKGNERGIFPNIDTYKEKPVHPIPGNIDTYKEKPVHPIPENPEHNRKVYSKEERKEERELSHFDFLKNYYPEKVNTWINEYGNKIFKKAEFVKAFNNQMELEEFDKTKKLWNRLNNYSRQWVRNQKESEKPEPKPPWLKTIG